HSDLIIIISNYNNHNHMESFIKIVEDILSIFKNNLLGAKYNLAFNKYMRLYKGESFNVDFSYGVGLDFN
ncbi:hypothetical protein ACY0I1_15980, partial [Clostridium perfringens]